MGKFYVHKNGVVLWAGVCPDGQESHQAPPGHEYGLGDPPEELTVNDTLPSPGYSLLRARAYPSIGSQMDMLWHAMDDGTLPKVEPFYSEIKAVKEAHPKE